MNEKIKRTLGFKPVSKSPLSVWRNVNDAILDIGLATVTCIMAVLLLASSIFILRAVVRLIAVYVFGLP